MVVAAVFVLLCCFVSCFFVLQVMVALALDLPFALSQKRSDMPGPASDHFRGIDGVIVAFDMTNPDSLNCVKRWFVAIHRFAPETVPRILIGTKSDMVSGTVLESDTIRQFADALSISFYETSAKTGHNVDQAFLALAEQTIAPPAFASPGMGRNSSSASVLSLDPTFQACVALLDFDKTGTITTANLERYRSIQSLIW